MRAGFEKLYGKEGGKKDRSGWKVHEHHFLLKRGGDHKKSPFKRGGKRKIYIDI